MNENNKHTKSLLSSVEMTSTNFNFWNSNKKSLDEKIVLDNSIANFTNGKKLNELFH